MKALVTGGGGFLGLYLVEQLLADGHDVRVFCRGQYDALDRLGVEVQSGDLRDAAAVEDACRNVEVVFHAAAVPGVWGRWSMFHSINTLGTSNLIAACLRQGVRRLIYTSSPSVVFDGRDHQQARETLPYPASWLCHYPHSKALAEQAVLAANATGELQTVSLRPHLIWGRRDNHLIPRLIQRAKSGRLRRVGDGTNLVSVCCVENAAAAHLQAERALRDTGVPAGRAYFINEPEPVNLWSWIDDILCAAGLPPVRKSISARGAYVLGGVLESLWTLLRLSGEPPMTRFVALQLSGSHSYSIEAARRDFNFTPQTTMAEALSRLQPELRRLAGTDSDADRERIREA